MKRLALAVAAFAAAQGAFAADEVEFKFGGEMRARYENWMTPSASSSNSQGASSVKSRARLNVTARKGERLQMMVSLLHGAGFGASAASNPDTAGSNYANTADNALQVSRAWGWWKASDSMSFKVGRMGIELGDGSVFSENDWEQNPTIHEGVMAGYDMDFAKIGLYLVKNRDAVPAAGGGDPSWDPEQNMYLLSFDFKNLPDALKTAHFHVAQITRDVYGNPGANTGSGTGGAGISTSEIGLNQQRLGLSLGGEAANIMYKLSGAYVFGNGKLRGATPADYTINQNMVDAMVGYHAADLMGAKFGVGFHRDSGGTTNAGDRKLDNYDSLFYDRHNNAGLMDVVRWGNLTYFDVMASLMPMEDLEAGVAYYMFSRTESATSAPSFFGANYGSLRGSVSESALGSELDVFVNKSYEGNFKIGAHWGMFMPENYLKNSNGNSAGRQDQTIMQAMVQGTMTF